MPYLKGESPSLLETYVPKITEAYLTSRYCCTSYMRLCRLVRSLLAMPSVAARPPWLFAGMQCVHTLLTSEHSPKTLLRTGHQPRSTCCAG